MENGYNPYETRKQRSLDMVNSGIEPSKDSDSVYWIPSQTQKGIKYKVELKENGWASCDCPDNQKGHLCKHIILLKFYMKARENAEVVKKKISITKPCPCCNSENLIKDGTRKTTIGKKQRWLCMDCKKRFVIEPISNIKGDLESVCMAMDLYMKGCSYRSISDTLRQFTGLRINHVTIMRWIQKFMEKINDYVKEMHPEVSDKWHADEQMVSVKGHWQYIWNCMDSETRFLLANNVTPTRSTPDARALFQQAKQTANKRATKVVTDGAFNYVKSVQKEFSTYQNRKPHERYVSIRNKSVNNNKIERYHGSFRQRDKSMRGFKSDEGVQKYTKNFKTYYNFIRPHSSLQQTPAEAGGLKVENNWKELLVKSLEISP